MTSNPPDDHLVLTQNIAEWRRYLLRQSAIQEEDADELESHLRDEIDVLIGAGLAADEAFLVATKRLGQIAAISHEFAEVHAGRLWRNLVFSPATSSASLLTVLLLALVAAIAIKAPLLFGVSMASHEWFFAYNISLFCLPMLAAYWVIERQLGQRGWLFVGSCTLFAAIYMNAMPWQLGGDTAVLAMLHLPLLLWFMVGVTYSGNWWRSDAKQMDFIRFSGEYFIYFVLVALGGAVLTAFTIGIFSFIDIDVEWFASQWIIPCGAMGAVVIVGYLVGAKQGAIETMAPVLARIFTPLFTLLLSVFLMVMLVTGKGFNLERDVLLGLNMMLILVLGLVLYSVSSKAPAQSPSLFDYLQLLLVVTALCVDLLALLAIGGRILELGLTPNRIAVLGANLLLLTSLAGYAWYYFLFIRARAGFVQLEQWQIKLIPFYVAWAAVVVFLLPLAFRFA
ncbi:permease prefix domain 1-containing protein [Pseudidiomarina sp. PP-1MA]|uniref:Permease prefix domain 1-containing protein n=1 Tax=Pseudidiomarina sp. PP-1MA TaxID=3237706 RepID=A0AB39X9S9_9GAMM